MRISVRLATRLACRVIARVLVPYSLFSREGLQIFPFDGKQFLFLIVNFALSMRRFNQFFQKQVI